MRDEFDYMGKHVKITINNDGNVATNLLTHDVNGNISTLPGRTLFFDPLQRLERVLLDNGTELRFFHPGFRDGSLRGRWLY